jgi:integrase
MSLYKRGEVWWVYITSNGRRVRQSTHTTEKAQAQLIHDELKVSLRKQKEAGKTLNDAIKLWLLASNRTDTEKSAIKVFLASYPSRPLNQISGHDILDALSTKSAGNYNRMVNNIRAAINLAVARKWCDPIDIPRKKVTNTKLRFLSKAEWARLEAELPPHLKPMAQFAISTGLRQSNVLNLKWASVDIDRAVAWVDSTDSKSSKAIPVPLSPYSVNILKSQIGKNPEFVFTYKTKPIKSIKTSWNKALIRAGIDLVDEGGKTTSSFRWHDLRHTWASWHVMNGTPLAVLKELGGWHDMSMVMRYAHLSPDHLAKYASNSVE